MASRPVPAMSWAASRAQRIALEDPPGPARLHDHDAHRVRDDVMHLARDPLALLDDGALGVRGSALVGPRRRLVQLAGQAGAAARRAARQAEGDDEDRREGGLADRQRAPDRAGRNDPADHQAHARRGAAPVLVRAEPEGERQQREPDRREVGGRRQPFGEQRHHQQARRRPQRERAPPRQGRRDRRHGDHVDRQRAAQVLRERELGEAPGQRDRGEGPVQALGTPHAGLPSGRRARRDRPAPREAAVLSSPP
jgi:hypothetical protein